MSALQTSIFPFASLDAGHVLLPDFKARYAHGRGMVDIRYSCSDTAASGKPVIVVLGGVSANADVIRADDGQPGWWAEQVGAGCAIDTEKYRVISMDYITGHSIVAAECTSITTADQADLLARLLSILNIDVVHAFVGASYGAMVGLAFAARHPARVRKLVAISGAHRAHPRATASRALQRQILHLTERVGDAATGVALARALAIIAYRDHAEFEARFDNTPERLAHGFRFPVERYLDHQGRKHAARVSAEDYRQLSESVDLHEVDPDSIAIPVTLVAADPDFLVPLSQLRELQSLICGRCDLHVLRSQYGHDAFLKESAKLATILHDELREGVCCE